MRSRTLDWIFTCFLITAAVACRGGTSSLTPISTEELQNLSVQTLRFQKNFDEYHAAEIEVHLIDTLTGDSFLCSGMEHGMQVVQNPGVKYEDLDATFIPTEDHETDEVRRFKIVVVERESRHCPDPLGEEGMQTLGETDEIDRSSLSEGTFKFHKQNDAFVTLKDLGEEPDPLVLGDLLDLRLKSLSVTSLASGEVTLPEVELHLMDVPNHRDLACIGDDQGLEKVDQENITYDDLFLSFALVAGIQPNEELSRLRFVLVERDDGRCPAPFSVRIDRVLSTSPVLSPSSLQQGLKIRLSQGVADLEVGTLGSYRQAFDLISPLSFGGLQVRSLRFFGQKYELSPPEVEVHLRDATTGETIACAATGLEAVDEEGVSYGGLSAPFQVIWQGAEDPLGLVRILLIDRDTSACPEPALDAHNDILDQAVVPFDNLASGTILFDNDSELVLGR